MITWNGTGRRSLSSTSCGGNPFNNSSRSSITASCNGSPTWGQPDQRLERPALFLSCPESVFGFRRTLFLRASTHAPFAAKPVLLLARSSDATRPLSFVKIAALEKQNRHFVSG